MLLSRDQDIKIHFEKGSLEFSKKAFYKVRAKAEIRHFKPQVEFDLVML